MPMSTTVPTIFHKLLAHYFALDSLRWLLLHGKQDEAIRILRKLSRKDNQTIRSLISVLQLSNMKGEHLDKHSAIKNLISKRWAIQRLVVSMILAFGISIVYISMPLGVGELSSNLHLSVTLNALLELPASVVAFLLLKHGNRKTTILFLSFFSGISSVICSVSKQ
ncbi:hypothetical protein Droror1_Dr00017021 [Drosera rotundifolia]